LVEGFTLDIEMGEKAKQLIESFEFVLRQGKTMKIGDLQQRTFEFFGDSNEAPHNISNLALLDKNTNSALNNSVFPVKRRRIFEAEREKEGYIPVCTKNVFLKYYSKDLLHISFWGKADRRDYLKSITDTLETFKPQTGK